MLLHGFPFDIHAYVDVRPSNWPRRAAAPSCPICAGYGPTRFRDPATLRSGEQAAIGADLIALMDALGVKRAVFRGLRLGRTSGLRGRGAVGRIAARAWCRSTVYLIQDIAKAIGAGQNRSARSRCGINIIFQLERGTGWSCRRPARHRQDLMAAMVRRTGISTMRPSNGTAEAHDNPDYVDVVIHSYRHRLRSG